jgi:hypothetical protein
MAEDLWDDSMRWINRLDKYNVEKTSDKPKIYEIPDDDNAIEKEVEDPSGDKPARIYRPEDKGTGIEE